MGRDNFGRIVSVYALKHALIDTVAALDLGAHAFHRSISSACWSQGIQPISPPACGVRSAASKCIWYSADPRVMSILSRGCSRLLPFAGVGRHNAGWVDRAPKAPQSLAGHVDDDRCEPYRPARFGRPTRWLRTYDSFRY